MGFLDFLTTKGNCPNCGTPGAVKSGGKWRCPNSICQNFDPSLQQQSGSGAVQSASGGQMQTPASAGASERLKGNFAPQKALNIRYRNFQGQEKTFTADAGSAVRKKNHIVVRVAPTGRHISLARDRIQNLAEVEAAFAQRVDPGQDWPTARERQVMGYHKKHGSTSPRYEEVRKKYPKW
jgi:hypothetical protein